MSAPIFPTSLPRLQGETIVLRGMDGRDADGLFAIYGDPAVMQYTDEAPFAGPDTVGQMLQSVESLLASGESIEWAIVPAGGDAPIGTCGLHSPDATLRTAEVGCLLRQSAWGQGRMVEAIGLLMAYARDLLRLRGLVADVDPDNRHAQRLFDKLGFRRDGPATWRIALDEQS